MPEAFLVWSGAILPAVRLARKAALELELILKVLRRYSPSASPCVAVFVAQHVPPAAGHGLYHPDWGL